VIKKFLTIMTLVSLGLLAASCSHTDSTSTTNVNANANTTADNSTAPTTTEGPDDSIITTTNENGVRTETRTFRNNPRVSKVVVTTRDGNRTVTAYSSSGEEREVKSAPERALDATGDAIADSAGWVKDKGGDVVDKTKETGKTVGEKTAEGTEKVVDKSADTAKTVGSKTKEGAKAVANKTEEGAKKATNAVKKVIP
jgi:hypothetical protein